MSGCFANHNQKIVLQKYLRQSPEQNAKMFEEMDKENKHGTRYYPLWRQAINFFGCMTFHQVSHKAQVSGESEMPDIIFTKEEKTEIIDGLNHTLEVYKEYLQDLVLWNKTKKDGLMSKFYQPEVDADITKTKNQIEMMKKLIKKVKNME